MFLTKQAPTRKTLSKLGVFAATEAIAVGGADARVLVMEHLRMTRLVYEIARDSDRSPATPEFNDALNEWNASHEALVPYSHALASATSAATTPMIMPTKAKRSTVRGEGQIKLIAALTLHHKYADGGSLNLNPICNNKLARLASVSKATASGFFVKHFGAHINYQRICQCTPRLVEKLKSFNQDFSPDYLTGNPDRLTDKPDGLTDDTNTKNY